jgi:hypothetical protein
VGTDIQRSDQQAGDGELKSHDPPRHEGSSNLSAIAMLR